MKKQFFYGLLTLGTLMGGGFANAMQNNQLLRYAYKGTEITLGFGQIEGQKFFNGVQSAIVNAANSNLQGGGGVDGAIHKAAGDHKVSSTGKITCKVCDGIRAKWDKWASDPLTGHTSSPYLEAGYVLTCGGHNLQSNGVNYIIHAVGPDCRDKNQNNDRGNLLKSVYLKSLQEAAENRITHIAFPQISVGIFEYPLKEAVSVVVDTIKEFIDKNQGKIKQIRLVMYNDNIGRKGYELYQPLLVKLEKQNQSGKQPVYPSNWHQPVKKQVSGSSFFSTYKMPIIVGGFGLGIIAAAFIASIFSK